MEKGVESLEIVVENIKKAYKENKAVDDISFSVKKGEVYGIIGPNGAGKTTLMEMMLGLRKQDSGTITIQGMDTIKDHKKLVYRIGAQLQESELPANIKVREAIRLQAALFGIKADVPKLLCDFHLEEKAGAYCSKLSGGQKQRLFILLAVIHDPDILFFDELSTGLDPVSRQDVWNYVEKLKDQGKTILVSTHYMQEAEKICDRVMMVNKGKVVDIGTAEELTGKLPFSRVIELESQDSQKTLEENLKKMKGFIGIEKMSEKNYRIYVKSKFSLDALMEEKKLNLSNVQSRQSSFEDYFYYKVKVKG